MLASLWHAPSSKNAMGTATTGSSEAIQLGGLAMKRIWQEKRKAAGKSIHEPGYVTRCLVSVNSPDNTFSPPVQISSWVPMLKWRWRSSLVILTWSAVLYQSRSKATTAWTLRGQCSMSTRIPSASLLFLGVSDVSVTHPNYRSFRLLCQVHTRATMSLSKKWPIFSTNTRRRPDILYPSMVSSGLLACRFEI